MNDSTMNSINVNGIIDRLKKAENIESDAQFARIIGMKPSALSMARKRNTIDLFRIFRTFEGYSKNWMIDGEGPVYRRKAKEEPDPELYIGIYDVPGFDPDDESQSLFTTDISNILSMDLTPEEKVEMINFYINFKSRDHEISLYKMNDPHHQLNR